MKPLWDLTRKRVLVIGAKGLVGSALLRRLERENCDVIASTRNDTDLTDTNATTELIKRTKPDCIILAAAKVGGILANRDHPVSFLQENLLIQLNVARAAHKFNVERLLLLGSSCIYPRLAAQPISERSLLTGPLEATNDAYALAKIADCADALIYLLMHYDNIGPINVGSGKDLEINDLAKMIAELTGFSGVIKHDHSKPDGTPEKRLDISRLMKLGWAPKIQLMRGISDTYKWYLGSIE